MLAQENATLQRRQRENLSGTEARRLVRAIDAIVTASLADRLKFPALPNHLGPTDGILQRWAAAPTGAPSEDFDLYRESRPPALDPVTQEAVSDVVKASPHGVRQFLIDWYCRHWLIVTKMAESRKLTRRQLGLERERVLLFTRDKFLASPHVDLVRLARMLP